MPVISDACDRIARITQSGIAERSQMLAALVGMIAERRIALVVEVVEQRDDAPLLFVLAELPRVAAHRGFDRERMLAQALALRPLSQELPGGVARDAVMAAQGYRVRFEVGKVQSARSHPRGGEALADHAGGNAR